MLSPQFCSVQSCETNESVASQIDDALAATTSVISIQWFYSLDSDVDVEKRRKKF